MTARFPLGSIPPEAMWLAFLNVSGASRRRLHALWKRCPDPESVLRLGRDRLLEWLPKASAAALQHAPPLRAAQESIRRLERFGARALLPSHPEFPPSLQEIPDPPLLIFVAGPTSSGRCVAIVGARKATARGRRFARELAEGAAACGLGVVSGLAYGIDAAAHEGALIGAQAAGTQPGVAVWAAGFEHPAPRAHAGLANRILRSGGSWISEYAVDLQARPHQFPERNRLISGLAEVSLVVEAAEASGSLWTARHALDQGREVMAVPGPIDLAVCRGSNRLLRDGAAPVLEIADLLAGFGLSPEVSGSGVPEAALHLSPAARGVLRALDEGPLTIDELARRLGSTPTALATACVELELAGQVVREAGMLARRSAASSRGVGSGETIP